MELDKFIHKLFFNLSFIKFRDFNERYAYYYAEETLYLIKDKTTGSYYFVTAYNPQEAVKKAKNKRRNLKIEKIVDGLLKKYDCDTYGTKEWEMVAEEIRKLFKKKSRKYAFDYASGNVLPF